MQVLLSKAHTACPAAQETSKCSAEQSVAVGCWLAGPCTGRVRAGKRVQLKHLGDLAGRAVAVVVPVHACDLPLAVHIPGDALQHTENSIAE